MGETFEFYVRLCVLKDWSKNTTERIRTHYSEVHLAGALALDPMTGCGPIMRFNFSDFITIALDQLVNQQQDSIIVWGKFLYHYHATASWIGTGTRLTFSKVWEIVTAHSGLKKCPTSNPMMLRIVALLRWRQYIAIYVYNTIIGYQTLWVPKGKYIIPLGVAI